MGNSESPSAQDKAGKLPGQRGRLKVYIGMVAGVGKTYAMLSDARVEKERGVDVVAGYIETHGRVETERMSADLEKLPVNLVEHRGVTLREFDLDAAIARSPHVLLVDELAHSNAAGCRHAKRWQDIEELLARGISVHTTVNVQHIESLRDVVAKITGIVVSETVPDSFIVQANDIELVDVPPEELIQRLKEGKIYAPNKVDQALNNFFKKGNLIALRELVLRHTAERVDAEMRTFRSANAVKTLWPTTNRILVCVGPNAMAARIVRAARRLASSLHAELIAVCIENPQYAHLPVERRELATKGLQLAEEVGAKTIVQSATDMVSEIIQIAHEHDVTLIVVGKPIKPKWRDYLFGSLADEIVRRSGDIDVQVITGESHEGTIIPRMPPAQALTFRGFLAAILVTGLSSAIGAVMYPLVDLSNIIMVYLLGVAWTATRYSRWEAVCAAVSSVLAFDFFFVPPHLTFAVSDAQYVITFLVMLVIALLISSLTLRVKAQAQVVNDRERRTAALYELSKQLATAASEEEVVLVSLNTLRQLLKEEAVILLPAKDNELRAVGRKLGSGQDASHEMGVARWVYEHGTKAGAGTDTLPGSKGLYFPLNCARGCVGVLGIVGEAKPLDISQRTLLEAFVSQIALALERIIIEQQSRAAELSLERERLRTSLLSSVSHDIRTPLASIAGAASVILQNPSLDEKQRVELTRTIADEVERLTRITRNVLDMTRLDSGHVQLNKDWHSFEELLGSALERTSSLLHPRLVSVQLPDKLPLIFVDGILVEQLFINLLENAARYTSDSTTIAITARFTNDSVLVTISDDGPGLAANEVEKVFEKLYRGKDASQGGFGLGLAICRAIAAAHDGTMTARNQTPHGASFTLSLPRIQPEPEVPSE